MQKKEVYKYIDRNIDTHVKNIQDWVKQQSVSWDNLGMLGRLFTNHIKS